MLGVWVDKPSSRHKCWRVNFRDHRGVARRLQGYRNKRASEKLGATLQDIAYCVGSGAEIPDELSRWLREQLEPAKLEKLQAWGVIGARQITAAAGLTVHLDKWHDHLISLGRKDDYCDSRRMRAKTVLAEGCGYAMFGEIDAQRVRAEIADQANQRRWSKTTAGHYLQSCKMFTKWMVTYGRAVRDPLAVVRVPGVSRSEYRHKRRPLTAGEASALVRWVRREGGRLCGMPGPERALMYQLVMFETGFRAGTVSTLRACDFDLGGKPPVVSGRVKGGKILEVPLSGEIVPMLKKHLGRKAPAARAFTTSRIDWFSESLKRDLRGAGIERKTEAGLVDFHALRHTFATMASKVMDPKTLQEIMGHSEITVTMKYYTHRLTSDMAAAKAGMPLCGAQCGAQAQEKHKKQDLRQHG